MLCVDMPRSPGGGDNTFYLHPLKLAKTSLTRSAVLCTSLRAVVPIITSEDDGTL